LGLRGGYGAEVVKILTTTWIFLLTPFHHSKLHKPKNDQSQTWMMMMMPVVITIGGL